MYSLLARLSDACGDAEEESVAIRIYSGRRAGKLSVAIELHALFDQDL